MKSGVWISPELFTKRLNVVESFALENAAVRIPHPFPTAERVLMTSLLDPRIPRSLQRITKTAETPRKV